VVSRIELKLRWTGTGDRLVDGSGRHVQRVTKKRAFVVGEHLRVYVQFRGRYMESVANRQKTLLVADGSLVLEDADASSVLRTEKRGVYYPNIRLREARS